jgi:hypothetical protein
MKNNQFSEEKINEVLNQIGSAINQVVKGVSESLSGSGTLITQEVKVQEFSGIKVKGKFEVVIKEGECGLVITADDNLVDKIKVTYEGKIIVLDVEPTFTLMRATLKAELTLPALEYLKVTGISDVTSKEVPCVSPMQVSVTGASKLSGKIETEALELSISGASAAKIILLVNEFDAEVSGTSNLKLKGDVEHARIHVSGTSSIKADKLDVKELLIHAEGTSNSIITVNGKVKAKASGTSNINLCGDATVVEQKISGVASIKKC